ncbi:NAD(P)/FAD-dependent oxidoreductase [Oceanomicrobium pacificus]|uniref:FAD-dependent oxidoreductase n=1 Tax=Oceanomicrobium pacificus TaxID=2692916 RepID=A0A6B0TUG9_9RHOB|nr:FAD-dependent oxidoreductase [Oceanomicrobium pacificus]MXU64892.1 FAD-dependent oxidoreductase [Oceanomicrobium pacificus]
MDDILVIGAGQAGAALVAKLRDLGVTAPVTLVGEEAAPPYQRPPLSKKYLLGEMARERLFLRPEQYYADQKIDLLTGLRADAIDRAAKQVRFNDGSTRPYGTLVLATGSVARRLPAAAGGEHSGVEVVRTLEDIDRLAPHVKPGGRMLVVGGGYIGLEAAAVAAQRGMDVTVIEAAPRILGRVASAETADYFRALHRAHGVDIREGVALDHLTGEDGRVTGAQLADGTGIAADIVVVGIGIAPATALAEEAGLAIDNGIAVDARGRTSDPAIFAVGDCASFPVSGGRLRLESVPHAIDHGEAVAAELAGQGADYVPKPWFWSDQYDVKLQIAGLNAGHDRTVTRPGSREGAQSVWYFKGGRLLAVDAMNDPRAYMTGKRWIEAGRSPDPDALADPATDLKGLV